MTERREFSRYLLPILTGVFALLILLLGASGYVAVSAIRSSESDASNLLEEQRATMRLIADVQLDEDSLSSVFYTLAARPDLREREHLFERLNKLQKVIQTRTESGLHSPEAAVWRQVQVAATDFIAEGRKVLTTGQAPGEAFFRTHEKLAANVADLATASVERSARKAGEESQRARSRVKFSLWLLAVAVAVASVAAGFTVFIINRMFRHLRWQAAELADLSSRSMSDQEETARRFSHELHDHFGQILNAIQANFVAMRNAGEYSAVRAEDCLALISDAIQNVREVSQLLRPRLLDDFGLDASLRWLAETFSERMQIQVEYKSSFEGRLADETETQLFRIAQEALTNISKHAQATKVEIELTVRNGVLELSIADNGRGFVMSHDERPAEEHQHRSLGLVGMRARARTAHGTLNIDSRPGSGVRIRVELPVESRKPITQDTNPAYG